MGNEGRAQPERLMKPLPRQPHPSAMPQTLAAPALLLCVASAACSSAPSEATKAHARDLAHRTIIVDGHVDLPYRLSGSPADVTKRTPTGDFDYVRAVEGGLSAPFLSI